MSRPINDNRGIRHTPSHGVSIYDGAEVEDNLILAYPKALTDDLANAQRWYAACSINVEICDTNMRSRFAAERKYTWRKRRAVWMAAKQSARVELRRIEREREKEA